MNDLPRVAGVLKGLAGSASTVADLPEFYKTTPDIPVNTGTVIIFSLVNGTVTSSGSMVAFSILHELKMSYFFAPNAFMYFGYAKEAVSKLTNEIKNS